MAAIGRDLVLQQVVSLAKQANLIGYPLGGFFVKQKLSIFSVQVFSLLLEEIDFAVCMRND